MTRMQPVSSADHARLPPLKKRVVDGRLPLLKKSGADYRLPPLKKGGVDGRIPPLKKGVVDRTAIGGGICSAAIPQIPRPRYARPAPFSKGDNSKRDSARIPLTGIHPFFTEPSP